MEKLPNPLSQTILVKDDFWELKSDDNEELDDSEIEDIPKADPEQSGSNSDYSTVAKRQRVLSRTAVEARKYATKQRERCQTAGFDGLSTDAPVRRSSGRHIRLLLKAPFILFLPFS